MHFGSVRAVTASGRQPLGVFGGFEHPFLDELGGNCSSPSRSTSAGTRIACADHADTGAERLRKGEPVPAPGPPGPEKPMPTGTTGRPDRAASMIMPG